MTNSAIASIWISVFQFLFLEKGEDKAVDRPHKSSSSLHVTRFVPHTESIFCPFRNWIIVTFCASNLVFTRKKFKRLKNFNFYVLYFCAKIQLGFCQVFHETHETSKKSLIFDQWSPNILKAKFKIFCKYENAPDATLGTLCDNWNNFKNMDHKHLLKIISQIVGKQLIVTKRITEIKHLCRYFWLKSNLVLKSHPP